MKKRVLVLIMAIAVLIGCMLFSTKSTVNAEVFPDVADTHWAKDYISIMKDMNVINGYEDGTYRPEDQVKTAEFIKMLCVTYWPDYEYRDVSDMHWSVSYLMSMDNIILNKAKYSPERLERVITREEAAELLCRFVQSYHSEKESVRALEREGNYIKNMKDEALITNEYSRIYIDNCIRFGLINGFEDGTFRPSDGLTRAQAAKLIYNALYVE